MGNYSYGEVGQDMCKSEAEYAATGEPGDTAFEAQIARRFFGAAARRPAWGGDTQAALFAGAAAAPAAAPALHACGVGAQLLAPDDAQPTPVFLAHGSYGRATLPAVAASLAWAAAIDAGAGPVRFFYATLYPRLVRALRRAAPLLGAAPQNLVFVVNVEAAIACVLKALPKLLPHSASSCSATEEINSSTSSNSTSNTSSITLATFNFSYAACQYALHNCAKENNWSFALIPTTFPISQASIVNDLTTFLESSKISVLLFEHIASPSALVLPIQSLVRICRENNILSIVDGAHGLGILDLQLDLWLPDFYATNAHKWLCHSRG
ncbi:hypothetical protein HK100_007931, partial [Physocladia obscura]